MPQTCRVLSRKTCSWASKARTSTTAERRRCDAFSQLFGAGNDGIGQGKQLPVGSLQTLSVAGPFTGGDAVDLSGQTLGLFVEMLLLSPTDGADLRGQITAQGQQLSQAVADQGAFGGVVDVGLCHEGVGPHRFRSLRNEPVSFGHDLMVDPLNGFRTDVGEVVLNPPPVEADLFVPVADAHDLTQGTVLLGQILELVVVEVTAQTHGGQHEDLPVVHATAAPLATRTVVDVLRDRRQNVITQVGLTVDVLQGFENRDDFVAAVEIQPHIQHRLRIKPPLSIEGFSHPYCSSKIAAGFVQTTIFLTNSARKRSHLRGAFLKKHSIKPGPKPSWDGH